MGLSVKRRKKKLVVIFKDKLWRRKGCKRRGTENEIGRVWKKVGQELVFFFAPSIMLKTFFLINLKGKLARKIKSLRIRFKERKKC